MRIRVERSLREEFLEACRAQDLHAAQVIRAFMRDYVRLQGRPPANDQVVAQATKKKGKKPA